MTRMIGILALLSALIAQPSTAATVTFKVTVTQRYACVTLGFACGYDRLFQPTEFYFHWTVPNVDGGQSQGPTTEVYTDLVSTRSSWGKNFPGDAFSPTPFAAEIEEMQSGSGTVVTSPTGLLEGVDTYRDWSAASGMSDSGTELTWLLDYRAESTPPPTGAGERYIYQSHTSLYLRRPLASAATVKLLDGPTVVERVRSAAESFEFVQSGRDMREAYVGGVYIGQTKYDYVEYTGTASIVSTPTDMLAALLMSVTGVGPGKSLADKITLAQTYSAVPDIQATCAMLSAFGNEVRAQRGKKIAVEVADELTADAQAIMTAIGCE